MKNGKKKPLNKEVKILLYTHVLFYQDDGIKQTTFDDKEMKMKMKQMKQNKLLVQLIDDKLLVPGENVFNVLLKVCLIS